jgi:competence protein ComEC
MILLKIKSVYIYEVFMKIMIYVNVCFLLILSCSLEGEREVALSLHFLDVGQGDALLIEQEASFYLIDAGRDSLDILDRLTERGVDTLEWVMISHMDRDHYGGLLDILEADIAIKKVYWNGSVKRNYYTDSLWYLLNKSDVETAILRRGDFMNDLAPYYIRVLWPQDVLVDDENNNSIIVRLEGEENCLWMGGDADSLVEKELLRLRDNASCNIWKAGHHGAASSGSPEFLATLEPSTVVISVGEGNTYGHPASSLISLLQYFMEEERILRTDEEGTIEVDWLYTE